MSRDAFGVLLALIVGSPGWADNFTVTNTDNGGKGSLRWAINRANNHLGRDRILFASHLAGTTIRPTTALPPLVDDRTLINGDINYDGMPDIVLGGNLAGQAEGLRIEGDGCVIKGLAIVRFARSGIFLYIADECAIRSCHVGVNRAGMKAARNGLSQIRLQSSHHNEIGGPRELDRNVIAAGAPPGQAGIALIGSRENQVRNNNIGIARDGRTPLTPAEESAVGIEIDVLRMIPRTDSRPDGAQDVGAALFRNVIGGTERSDRNVFGGMGRAVVVRAANSNRIWRNYFGLGRDGRTQVPIGEACVDISDGASGTWVGDPALQGRNLFAGGAVGVSVRDETTGGTRVDGNYFGLDAAGTRQRSLETCIHLSQSAYGAVIMNNTFAPRHVGPAPTGILFDRAGQGSWVEDNLFGLWTTYPRYVPLHRAVYVRQVSVNIEENYFFRVRIAVDCSYTPLPTPIALNRFQECTIAVLLHRGAQATLGNLHNGDEHDDGKNLFYASNKWNIRNMTPHKVMAENNYFATTSRAHINAKIWDWTDDHSLGKVDFAPLMGGVWPTSGGAGPLAVTAAAVRPTAGGVQITFSLSSAAQVQARVLNIAGRPVKTLCQARDCEAGTNTLVWNATGDGGLVVPNGVYLVEVTAEAEDGSRARALGQVRIHG